MKKFLLLNLLILNIFNLGNAIAEENKKNISKKGYFLQIGGGYRDSKVMAARHNSSGYEKGGFGDRTFNQNSGYEIDFGIGYRFNKKYSVLFDIKHYENSIEKFTHPFEGGGGKYIDKPKFSVQAYTVNIFRDFPLKGKKKLSPYLGLGIGLAQANNPNFGTYELNTGTTGTSSHIATDNSYLYKKAMAGINYQISSRNSIFIESSYGGVDHYIINVKNTSKDVFELQNGNALSFNAGLRIGL